MIKTFGEGAFDLTAPLRGMDASMGMDNAAVGVMLSFGSLTYAIGKLTLGPVIDYLGGQASFSAFLAVCGAAFGGISVARGPAQLKWAWGAANYALAGAWGAISHGAR
jgi:sugar phosphate permease